MFSLSQDAVKIVKEKVIPFAEQLNCKVLHLTNGTTVIDMGVEAPGGWLAGKLFVEATIAGLGHVDFGRFQLGSIDLPSIDVYIDHPQEACLSSQFSSWPMPPVPAGVIQKMGSGPARAIAKNDMFVNLWDYTDTAHETVFGYQSYAMPGDDLANQIATACRICPENLYILVAKTGSIAGSIQVCSRTVETSIWRLHKSGLDLHKIICGMGTCPIAPPSRDEFKAMVRANSAVIYGGMVRYVVDCSDAEIEAILPVLPTMAAKRYGMPFGQMFEEGGRDVFKTDKDINSVALWEIQNYNTGTVFRVGEIKEEYLREIIE